MQLAKRIHAQYVSIRYTERLADAGIDIAPEKIVDKSAPLRCARVPDLQGGTGDVEAALSLQRDTIHLLVAIDTIEFTRGSE